MTDPAGGASTLLQHPSAPRIAFLRSVDNTVALHLIGLDGGEARLLAKLGAGATNSPDWDADAGRLLVRAEVAERDGQAPAVVESLPLELDGLGIVVGKRIGLAQVDEASGECHWLETRGDVSEAEWSPDRTQLA